MIKVVNVISDSNIGGAGNMLLTFLRNYDRTAINTMVALPRGSLLIERLQEINVPFTELDGLAERSLGPAGILNLTKFLKTEQPNIVHTHASMSARIAARLTPGTKVVYTRHSVFPNRYALTVFPGKQVFGGVNNIFADKVIAVSPAARDNIIETGVSSKKIEVIYNGVDSLKRHSPEEKQKARADWGLGNEFMCGIFARLTPVKGHEYILDAARILLSRKDIKIVIAGTGESEEDLKSRAIKENLTNVVFLGFVKEAPRLIAAMDLLLNASYGTEATSLFLLEGMSVGIPAVVSSFGGNPYVIRDNANGFVVPQKDGQALAEAIVKMADDRALYKRMSRNAAETYSERFTSKVMTLNTEKLYFSMLR